MKIYWRKLAGNELVEEDDYWYKVKFVKGDSKPSDTYMHVWSKFVGKTVAELINKNGWVIVRPTMLYKDDTEPRIEEGERQLDPNL